MMSALLVKLVLFVQGILGGVVLLMVEKAKSYWDSARLLLVSGIAAAMLAPAVVEHYKLGPHAGAAVCTLIGLAAWKLVQGLVKLLNKFSKDPVSIIRLWRK